MKVKGKLMAVILSLMMVFSMGALTACGDKNVAVTGITLPEKTTVEIGSSITLTPTFAPENPTNKKVSWSSDTEDVATVDATGKVVGVKLGNAIITAVSEDGEFEASCFVEVVIPIGAKLLTLTVDGGVNDGITMSFYEKGVIDISSFTADIGMTVLPATAFRTNWKVTDGLIEIAEGNTIVTAGSMQIPYPVTFTIDDTNSVVKMGAVLENGTPVNFADFAFTTAQYDVLVDGYIETVNAVEGITLNKNTLALYRTQVDILIATITPDYASDKTVTWSSSNPAIVTADRGSVTATGVGTATVTATAVGGLTATCAVTVTEKIDAESISVPETLALAFGKNGVGQKGTVAVTFAPADTSNKAVKCVSSDTKVATVNDSGEVTPLKVGTTTITVTSVDNKSATDTCVVTITEIPVVKYSESGISSMVFTADGKVTVSVMAMDETIIYNASAKTTWTNSSGLAITNATTTGTNMDYVSGNSVIKIDTAATEPAQAMALLKGTIKFVITDGSAGAKNVKVVFEYAQPETGTKPADIEFVTFTLTSAELAFLTAQA